MLNDREIRTALKNDMIGIEPFDDSQMQPVSYDLRLAKEIRVPREDIHMIDPGMAVEGRVTTYYGKVPPWSTHTTGRDLPPNGRYIKHGEFMLGCTQEVIRLSPFVAARVEGKSSLGRLGLAVHITAGFIDPGFEGQITLEIANLAPWNIVLYPGMPIAQIVFEPVTPPDEDYTQTGRYNGQRGPTESRYRLR